MQEIEVHIFTVIRCRSVFYVNDFSINYFIIRISVSIFNRSASVISLITLQGFPAAITFAGISFVTTLPAPMILQSPI